MHSSSWNIHSRKYTIDSSCLLRSRLGGNVDDYTSPNAYVLYLGANLISCSSKKQRGVVRSSTETEYHDVANTTSKIQLVCSLLTDLGITLQTTLVIFFDNIGATYMYANPVFYSRMKNIVLDYHFILDNVQAEALCLTHVSIRNQLGCALTKALARPRFTEIMSKIGVT